MITKIDEYSTHIINLEYDDRGILIATIKIGFGDLTEDELKSLLISLKAENVIDKYPVKALLFDFSEAVFALTDEFNKWIIENLSKYFLEKEIYIFADVFPEKYFIAKVGLERFFQQLFKERDRFLKQLNKEHLITKIHHNFFDNKEEALNWIVEKIKQNEQQVAGITPIKEFSSRVVSFDYDNRGILIATFHINFGELTEDELKTFLSNFDKVITKYNVKGILFDLRDVVFIFSDEITLWIMKNLSETFFKHNIFNFAYILPQDSIAKLSMKDFFERLFSNVGKKLQETGKHEYLNKIRRAFWDSKEQALDWLYERIRNA